MVDLLLHHSLIIQGGLVKLLIAMQSLEGVSYYGQAFMTAFDSKADLKKICCLKIHY